MTEEFNLSEKRCTNFREDFVGRKDENAWFLEREVKEFIKHLKEEIWKISLKTASGRNRLPSSVLVEVEETIDKLVGDKLKWKNKKLKYFVQKKK